jgi:hypothetical protein
LPDFDADCLQPAGCQGFDLCAGQWPRARGDGVAGYGIDDQPAVLAEMDLGAPPASDQPADRRLPLRLAKEQRGGRRSASVPQIVRGDHLVERHSA